MKYFMCICVASVLALPPTLFSYPSSHKLPVMANGVIRCDQGYDECDPTHCSNSTLGKAWDFNLNGTTGDGDLGLPVTACADGRIVYAQNYNPGQSDAWGNCIVVKYDSGASNHRGLYAHIEQILVKVGELVKQGQVLGTIGKGDGNYSAHLHYQVQSGDDPDASSVSAAFSDVGFPTSPNNYTSLNHNIFDLAETGNHGSEDGSVHWWTGNWNASDRYDGNNCARRCYIQDYQGGSWNDCAIVYDALGGARKAYTVRTGFWENGQDNGWSEIGGPQSSLGMPITNEYSISTGARQEFQKGYMIFENNSVSVVTYSSVGKVAPGWTSSGWNNQYSYLFALAYERNGGATTVGLPSSAVYSYGNYGYLRQDFSGGSYGNCCIMYDSANAIGNDAATNEAYLLRTGFYSFYQANGGSALGCPTRDEYMSHDPENWSDPNEYAVQNLFDRAAYEDDEAPQHYLIYKNGSTSYHSAYTTDYVSQSPTGQFNMAQGETRTFTVSFNNTGSNTWYNSSSHLDAYVELKSCDANGATCASFLNYPYSGSLGWLNEQAPCTMQQSSVAPGDTATFTFTGKVASNASLGLHDVYFRPNHSVGGLMEGWDGMHFQVFVTSSAATADLATLYTYGSNSNKLHTFLSTGSTFQYQGDAGWWASNGYTTANVLHSLSGDYDADGYTDVAVVYANSSNSVVIHVFLSNGSSFEYQGDNGWWNSGSGYDPSKVTKAASADFDHDGDDDIVLMYDYGSYVRFHMLLSNRSSFVYQGNNGWWDSGSGYYASNVKFVAAGDFNGDDKRDLAIVYDYSSYLRVHILLSTGSAFSWQGNGGWWDSGAGYYASNVKHFIAGNFDATRGTDLALIYDHDTHTHVHILLSNANMNGFDWQGNNGWWDSSTGYYASRVVKACEGDFNGDGVSDLVFAYKYSTSEMRLHALLSTQSAFSYQGDNGWWSSTSFTSDNMLGLVSGYFNATGSSKLIAFDQSNSALPRVMSLEQNFPNPFNPVTMISYSVPQALHVSLTVYNILGQEVAKLVDSYQSAGTYSVPFDAKGLPSGVYLYRLHTDQATETRKMLILK